MTYSCQAHPSQYIAHEELSSFKKRWNYRPTSTLSVSKLHRKLSATGVSNSRDQLERWEPLRGWEPPEERTLDHVDIDSWRNKLHEERKSKGSITIQKPQPWEPYLCTAADICPSISNHQEFLEASVTGNFNTPKPWAGPTKNYTTTSSVVSQSPDNQALGTEIQHLDDDEVKSRNGGSEEGAVPSCNEQEGDKTVQRTSDASENFRKAPGSGDKSKIQEEVKGAMHSGLISLSAPSLRVQKKVVPGRQVSSARVDKSKASGDSLRKNVLKNSSKKSIQDKMVAINLVPIDIAYDPPPGESQEDKNEDQETLPTLRDPAFPNLDGQLATTDSFSDDTFHRVNIRTPDRRALEEELKKSDTSSFELPSLAAMSIGDLLQSSPRIEYRIDETSLKQNHSLIESLYSSKGKAPTTSAGTIDIAQTASFNHDSSIGSMPEKKTSLPSISQRKSPDCKNPPLSSESPRSVQKQNSAPVMSQVGRLSSESQESYKSNCTTESAKFHVSESILLQQQPQRGPPGFRPHPNKTPLQRAMENAQKKIYGDHYHLLSPHNVMLRQVEMSRSNMSREDRARQTKSARQDYTTNAYTWKEHLNNRIKQQRSMSAKQSSHHSKDLSSQTNPSTDNIPVPSSASLSNHQIELQKSYSELCRLAKQRKLQFRQGLEKRMNYLSDSKTQSGNIGILRTPRGKVGQK